MTYDPKKAEAYNKLIQSGMSEDAAFAQSGITAAETGNYALGDNGQLGAIIAGGGKVAGVDFDRPTVAETAESNRFDQGLASPFNFEQVDYAQTASAPPSSLTPINYNTTSTETVSGGGSTTIATGPRVPTAESQAIQPAINANQAKIDQFIKDNPSDFARKKQGLPPLTPEENQQRQEQLARLTAEREALTNQQIDAETPSTPTVITVPNTTTTTQTVTTGTSSTNQAVDPFNDEKLSQENEAQLDATPSAANALTTREAAPVPGAPGLLDPQQQAALAVQNTTAESVPLTDAESAALFEEAEANTIQNTTADPADDPYEAARLAAEEGEPPPTFEAEDLEDSPYEVARLAGEQEGDGPTLEAPEPVNDFVIDPVTGEQVPSDSDRAAEIRAEAAADEQVQVTAPAPVADSTQAEGNAGEAEASAPPAGAPGTLDPQQQAANEQAAAKANTINQATLNSVYKKEGSADWRVRLQLAPSSNYLYNQPEGQRGILDSLYYTNGVIFPYTPQINTSYKANYEQYDLVHSNYRGVYYKNSRVDDLQIRGVFTAQDTNEANYLLAVIHFFRSVTKMFYGKDDQRGTPPPLVYLSGFGMDQFYGHPCVVTSFAYNLPDNVDYIRATSVNNYGTDLLSRRTASSPSSAAGLGATGNRLLNAGLANFTATPPAPSSVVASINNTQLANYVPTKMDIDITLIPVQTRSQVSKQFSLKGFANGNLIKGGFW